MNTKPISGSTTITTTAAATPRAAATAQATAIDAHEVAQPPSKFAQAAKLSDTVDAHTTSTSATEDQLNKVNLGGPNPSSSAMATLSAGGSKSAPDRSLPTQRNTMQRGPIETDDRDAVEKQLDQDIGIVGGGAWHPTSQRSVGEDTEDTEEAMETALEVTTEGVLNTAHVAEIVGAVRASQAAVALGGVAEIEAMPLIAAAAVGYTIGKVVNAGITYGLGKSLGEWVYDKTHQSAKDQMAGAPPIQGLDGGAAEEAVGRWTAERSRVGDLDKKAHPTGDGEGPPDSLIAKDGAAGLILRTGNEQKADRAAVGARLKAEDPVTKNKSNPVPRGPDQSRG